MQRCLLQNLLHELESKSKTSASDQDEVTWTIFNLHLQLLKQGKNWQNI